MKKCEQKLNQLERTIQVKENERIAKDEQRGKKRKEFQSLRKSLDELYKEKEVLGANYDKARTDMNREHDEMKRIQSELLYKDKKEYEDMIRRLENDMQFNSKKFSSHEEKRILTDIAHHKRGMVLLEQFESKKKLYEELRQSSSAKKQELDNAIGHIMDRKKQQQMCHEAIQTLSREIEAVKNEIAELTTQKHDYKKQIEDHIKENVIRQQQAKKAIKEQHHLEKMKIKADEVLLDMENVQKDYNKLIGYFYKLTTSASMDSVSPCGAETPSSRSAAARPTLSSLAAQPSTSLNVSASSPSFSQSFNQSSSPSSSTSSSLLSLSLSNNLELANEISNAAAANTPSSPCQNKLLSACRSMECSSMQQQKLAPPNTLGINFQLQTTSLGESPVYTFKSPIDEFGGCFVMKQKIDDDNSSRKRNWRRSKQKSVKVSHPVEVINLLIKMNIPINLSSQHEECLKLLHNRRDDVTLQLNTYRAQKVVEMKSTAANAAAAASVSSSASGGAASVASSLRSDSGKQEPDSDNNNKHSGSSMMLLGALEGSQSVNDNDNNGAADNAGGMGTGNNILFSDNNSEISSCLDSNYDSDTSFHYKNNNNSNSNSNDTGKQFDAKLIESFLSRQSTITNSLNFTAANGGHNTTDADLHAVTDHLLKEQMRITEQLETAGAGADADGLLKKVSSRSSSPNTPTNNNNEENAAFSPSSVSSSVKGNNNNSNNFESQHHHQTADVETKAKSIKDSKLLNQGILRQLSDGYSSSCSPLSASSINNEQPSVNPFFPDSTAAATITAGLSSSNSIAQDSSANHKPPATPPKLNQQHESSEKAAEEHPHPPPASILS